MMVPDLHASTREEREDYINKTFYCRHNCEMCGICAIYKGKDPLVVYKDYIEGRTDFYEIARQYQR